MYFAFLYYTAVAMYSYEAFFLLIDDESDSDDQIEDGEAYVSIKLD